MSGLWDQEGVPHKGWTCVGIEDLEENRQTCAMCRSQPIRYVHIMEHPNYGETLDAGCECASKMEEDYASAKSRERTMKNAVSRKRNWIKRKWRTSYKGNSYLNVDGFNIATYLKNNIWGAKVTYKETDDTTFSRKPFKTEDEAKLAAFNQMILMKEKYKDETNSNNN